MLGVVCGAFRIHIAQNARSRERDAYEATHDRTLRDLVLQRDVQPRVLHVRAISLCHRDIVPFREEHHTDTARISKSAELGSPARSHLGWTSRRMREGV